MWNDIKNWFKHSLTIVWARLQTFGGILLTALASVDLSPLSSVFDQKLAGVWLVVSGIITEIARRRTLPSS